MLFKLVIFIITTEAILIVNPTKREFKFRYAPCRTNPQKCNTGCKFGGFQPNGIGKCGGNGNAFCICQEDPAVTHINYHANTPRGVWAQYTRAPMTARYTYNPLATVKGSHPEDYKYHVEYILKHRNEFLHPENVYKMAANP